VIIVQYREQYQCHAEYGISITNGFANLHAGTCDMCDMVTCVVIQLCMLRCKVTYLPCRSAANAAPTNTAGEPIVSLVTDWTARVKPGGCIASGLKPAVGKDSMIDCYMPIVVCSNCLYDTNFQSCSGPHQAQDA